MIFGVDMSLQSPGWKLQDEQVTWPFNRHNGAVEILSLADEMLSRKNFVYSIKKINFLYLRITSLLIDKTIFRNKFWKKQTVIPACNRSTTLFSPLLPAKGGGGEDESA